jgi:hypothetical protein
MKLFIPEINTIGRYASALSLENLFRTSLIFAASLAAFTSLLHSSRLQPCLQKLDRIELQWQTLWLIIHCIYVPGLKSRFLRLSTHPFPHAFYAHGFKTFYGCNKLECFILERLSSKA